ncbi:TetR family transcriptional regulator [Pseudonocardia spinosispora]|uniref:TetR family transcriptional regulator n=1 Tax=Pseudonocardia spinosispora TaxID=103441 RepID=UPI00048EFD11|nr:TetR family transcriptional regulator [Pseudonocardia spinosispora]
MGRWEPNASGRLREAALELYVERGFDNTTVAEIADRAGLTARTFFRHFADKREVLFAGSNTLLERLRGALDEAPDVASPMEAAVAALGTASAELTQHRDYARRRQSVITANAELRERELVKMATLSTTITTSLGAKGVPEADAHMAAEVAIAVFRVAFERWLTDQPERPLTEVIDESLLHLRALAAPAP